MTFGVYVPHRLKSETTLPPSTDRGPTGFHLLVTGATGLIGRSLVPRLQQLGYHLIALTRDLRRARACLGPAIELAPVTLDPPELAKLMARVTGVINLAGESVGQGRWTPARKAALRHSRIDLTARLTAAATMSWPGSVWVNASAVGYYGDQGDALLDEHSPAGTGFLAELCRDWEAAAPRAATGPTRVIWLRLGVVFARSGGLLERLLPATRWGAGGPLGSGKQFLPWIHLEDLLRIIEQALADVRYHGPINAVAPQHLQQGELARTLQELLGTKLAIGAPRLALQLALGEQAQLLLASQRVVPQRLQELGFGFRYPTHLAALRDVLGLPPSFGSAPTAGAHD